METKNLIPHCVYRGDAAGPGFHCQLHTQCFLSNGTAQVPGCDTCKDRLSIENPYLASTWQDGLRLFDRDRRETTGLRGLLAGRRVFLTCGGPSANSLNLARLHARGCWTMCVNNMAGHPAFRPQAMVCTDPPSKFSGSIWHDPAIMKFIPTPKLLRSRGVLRRKENGEFKPAGWSFECPNVWGFDRRKWIVPDDSFFLAPGASNGQYDVGVRQYGGEKTICTMLSAMRLLRYLGASQVFLLGVDFHMDVAATANYAFPEGRDEAACESNNRQYRIINDWLCQLENNGVFKRFGIEFYNCNPVSGLRAFPYVPFEDALKVVIGDVEETPDLRDWYVK